MADATLDLMASHTEMAYSAPYPFFAEAVYDASVLANRLSAAESVSLIYIPIDTFVISVIWEVRVIEDSTLTFDVGDEASATQYVSNAAGAALTHATDYTKAKIYTTASDIRITVDNDVDTVIISLKVIGFRVPDHFDAAAYA